MGCDIHMIAEMRSKYSDDINGWVPMLSPIFKNIYYERSKSLSRWNSPYNFQPYDDRNYALFSVLANVRNGYDIKPISEPRDYPEDMHKISRWLLDGWDFVDHSMSWLSLNEILDYNWDQPTPYGIGKLSDTCKDFLENCNKLKEFAEEENCEIRLIFGFDS